MRLVLILAVALNGLAFDVSAQSATSTPLTTLKTEVRDDIARICLPIQYREGAEAYRNCVKEQVATRGETKRLDKTMDAFSSLSFDDRYAIQQACGSQNSESSRRCTANQISELSTLPEPNFSDITNDELYVMQQTCFHAQSKQGAAVYRQCQLNEIASVKNVAAPNYANLDIVKRNALQLKCSANQSRLLDYRDCLVSGLNSLNADAPSAATVVAEISQPAIQPSNAQRTALIPSSTVVTVQTNTAQIRPTLIQPTAVQVEAEQNVIQPALAKALPSTPTAVTPIEDINPVEQPQAQTQSATEEQSTTDVIVTDTTSAPDVSENADGSGNDSLETATNVFDTLKNFVLEFFNGLSTQGKMLLAAIVFMPMALWALLSGNKRRDRDYDHEYDDESEYANEDLKSRVRPRTKPSLQQSSLNDTDADISANWAAEVDSLFDDTPTLQPESTHNHQRAEHEAQLAPQSQYAQIDEYAPTKLIKPVPAVEPVSHHPAKTQRPAAEEATRIITAPPSAHYPDDSQAEPITARASQGGFAHWLHSLPGNEQHSLAIEFLLYWIAFGDERYDPALKQRIFQDPNPSNKDIVKRWVLKEDVHAFADVIDWLQRNTTAIQKVQIVRLLMAMLVNGHEPTPVQNTLFRFLSDAFYFKDPTLEEMFEEDFQADLPAIPRVDRMAWWDRQSPGTVSSWNARKLNNSDEITRLAAQLGVDGEARSEHVEAAYELAARRCSAERFDHLSENEHQLILSRRNRLEQARDGLLEALA